MYESFFGLRTKPFELVPNPDFLYLSKTHNKVGVYLDYAMKENSGFVLLTGEVGAGKTTIIRNLVRNIGQDVQIAKIFNTKLDASELLASINDDFGLTIEGRSKVQLLKDLYQFLIEQFAQNRRSMLIIDEAQNLSIDTLEELRLLSNLETNDAKLLQIVLVGQPELKKVLSVPELRQLRQRIGIHSHLQSLGREEAKHYIFHRLEIAGNRQAVAFADGALDLIFEYTGGVPRLINILCDFLLLSAFADESREIAAELVVEVAEDPQFEGQFSPRRSPLRPATRKPPVLPREATMSKETKAPPPGPEPMPAAVRQVEFAPEERARIENLYEKLDIIEASIREVGENLASPGPGEGAREADIVLNMPRFDAFPAKKTGFLEGFKRMFSR
jgi:putative secretion ATPase (PEP-CTERM system associated)